MHLPYYTTSTVNYIIHKVWCFLCLPHKSVTFGLASNFTEKQNQTTKTQTNKERKREKNRKQRKSKMNNKQAKIILKKKSLCQ